MIDHLLGRPSPSWKRFQVFIVSFTWFWYIYKADRRGPKFCQKWNDKLSQFTPFQLIAGTLAFLYMLKNADRMIGLGAPEPLSRLYSRNFYRATWIYTALDAGFWTAMPIRPKFLKDIMSIVFSIYYLIFADQADEKIRRIRATITVEQLRVSWEKSYNPILRAAIRLKQPRLSIFQKRILIPRPKNNPHGTRPVIGYIYYAGSPESLANQDKLVLDFPGGGFIAMPPPCHEDYLSHWAKRTQVPVLSIDYSKAPEFPYPYALEECFDVYQSIMESNGEVIGIAGWTNKDGSKRKQIKVVMAGDSAGGNLVTSVMFKILESSTTLPHPTALVLIYPCLNFDITCWMAPSQLSVIRAESAHSIPGVLESKDHLRHKSPLSVVPDVKRKRWRKSFSGPREDERTIEERVKYIDGHDVTGNPKEKTSRPVIGTRLTMTSRMSFFNDRIINPDMMRAMAILYLGPNNYPDINSDYLLSPIVGPDELLAQFPKVYLMCGEKDPFVDDTVVFAGRIREAKRRKKQMTDGGKFGEGLRMSSVEKSDNDDWVEVKILQGISHAFLQMMSVLPESSGAVRAIGRWLIQSLQDLPDSNFKNDNNTSNRRSVTNQDEGLIISSRPSTIKDMAKIQQNVISSISNDLSQQQKIHSTSPKSNIHVSHSLPDVTLVNENSHKPSSYPIHVSASEVALSPVQERERVLWEERNILKEDEMLQRRRDDLLTHLTEGCNTTTTDQENMIKK
ncbi:4959_t:CDS:2 [Funneliformis mosseae]|uniref:4959_t:CDS:1 n=1 Tax=Funneliformis mosseae TaxID=27381 RepID=A0A9N9B5U9_FUNMO|nr:4959_t:CDS:2 [Funneliformis mosseae]